MSISYFPVKVYVAKPFAAELHGLNNRQRETVKARRETVEKLLGELREADLAGLRTDSGSVGGGQLSSQDLRVVLALRRDPRKLSRI